MSISFASKVAIFSLTIVFNFSISTRAFSSSVKGLTVAGLHITEYLVSPKPLPVLLIIRQPDYGTASAFIVALLFMLIIAGIDKKYVIGAIVAVIVLVPIIYMYVLPAHAKIRIDVFFIIVFVLFGWLKRRFSNLLLKLKG